MRSKIASEPFRKFSADFLQSKLNKYKNSVSKGIISIILLCLFLGADNLILKGLLSRLIQLKKFQAPSLSEMSSSEWTTYLGKQLVIYFLS